MTSSKTRSVCLLCLKRFGGGDSFETGVDGSYESRVLAENCGFVQITQGQGQDEAAEKSKPAVDLYTRFLQMTGRYLKVPTTDLMLRMAKEHQEKTGGAVVVFCDECRDLVKHLCDLHAELQAVKLHLLQKLDLLENVTRSGSKRVSQKMSRTLLKALSEQTNTPLRQIELFRKTILLNCKRRFKGSSPQLCLHKGLFPEYWKYTFASTKKTLMNLILVFALATVPPEGKPKPKEIKRKPEERRIKSEKRIKSEPISSIGKGPMCFGDIAQKLFNGDTTFSKPSELGIKGEHGDDHGNEDEDDGMFLDNANDNDSDWSAHAASPMGSVSSPVSDVNPNSDDEDYSPRKRSLRRTRSKVAATTEQGSDAENESDKDPEYTSKKSGSPKKKVKPGRESRVASIPCKIAACNKRFIDRRGLAKHLKLIHNTHITYNCTVCGLKCKTAMEMAAHRRQTHGLGLNSERPSLKSGILPCPKCDRKFIDTRGLSRHMLGYHNSRLEYKCNICGHMSKGAVEHVTHRKFHRKRETAVPVSKGVRRVRRSLLGTSCSKCEVEFKTRAELISHRRLVHAYTSVTVPKYECPICMKKIVTDERFKIHMVNHEKDSSLLRRFHCEVCGITFHEKDTLSEHFNTEHNGTYDCNLCKLPFPTGVFLRKHLERHETEEKNYHCYFCYRRYTHEQLWRIHRKIAHVGNERIFCDESQCPKEFETVNELNEHLSVHSVITPATSEAQASEEDNVKPNIADVEEKEIFKCATCGWGFLDKYRLIVHELVHIPFEKDSGYTCPGEGCKKTFRLKDKLIAHYRSSHAESREDTYKCNECGYIFNEYVWFKVHLRLHEERKSGRKFVCTVCQHECVDSIQLSSHREIHKASSQEVFQRRPRGRPPWKLKTKEDLEREKQEKEELANTPCEACQAVFASVHQLRRHLDKNHESLLAEEEKRMKCNFCYLKYGLKQSLDLHCKSIHLTTYKFVCDGEGCNASYNDHMSLNEHLKTVHLESESSVSENVKEDTNTLQPPMKVQEVLYCKFCDWGFLNPDMLQLHELVHIPCLEKDVYQCPDCSKKLPSTSRLVSHWNAVHGKQIKPYKCVKCQVTFTARQGLRHHLRKHKLAGDFLKGEKFLCHECGKEFSCGYKLNQHRKQHDPSTHLTCPEGCGLTFVDRTKLNIHLKKKHGHGDMYPCPECGMQFLYTHEVKKHVEWVHGPAQFKCDQCDKVYKRPNALRCHKRTHDPNLPTHGYVCSECGSAYKTEEGLKYHIGSKHTPNHLKKYACPECTYMTHRPGLLRMHIKVCFRNKGLPYDEEKFGKLPTKINKGRPPPKNPGRRRAFARKKKEEEEEMEEQSTTEDESSGDEEAKPEVSQSAPVLYPHQVPQASHHPANLTTINTILNSLTGIPELISARQAEASDTQVKKRRGRPSKKANVEASTAQSSSSTQPSFPPHTQNHQDNLFNPSTPQAFPLPPQLFGPNSGDQYQNWINSASAATTSFLTPPPHIQQHNVDSPNHVYSPLSDSSQSYNSGK